MLWGVVLGLLAVSYAQDLPFVTNSTYNATSPTPLEDGTGWDFVLVNNTNFTNFDEEVIPNLIVQVRYVSADIVRVRIIDANNTRWEVPDVVDITTYFNGTPNYSPAFTLTPFSLTITRNSDSAVLVNLTETLQYTDQDIIFTNDFNRTTSFYGIGERVTPTFQLVAGGVYTTFAKDTPSPVDYGDNNAANMYGSHPFFLAVDNETLNASGGFLLNSNAMDTYIDEDFIQFRTIGGVIDYFAFAGPSIQAVLKQYHSLIGQPALVPYWGLGWHQCRWGYNNTAELADVLNNYTYYDLPLDVLWSDIDYMDNYADFTVSPVNYANLSSLISELHSQNKHYVPILDAGIPNITETYSNLTYTVYSEGLAQNVFIISPFNQSEPFVGKVWPGSAVFVDWSNPNASAYWVSLLKAFQSSVQFDGLWIDMNEASNFCPGECSPLTPAFDSSALPYLPGGVDLNIQNIDLNASHYNGKQEYDYHSLYGFKMGNATSQYFKQINSRPFIISRSTFPSSGQYNQHWLGDNWSNWTYLEYSIIGIYNFQMYGIPFVGADICGLLNDTTSELCSRWMQLGTLYPFARNHNNFTAISQEPYALGNVTLATSQGSIRLRYCLLNYIYTLLFKHTQDGGVWFKPAFFEYTNDTELFQNHVSDNFMLGASLIVHPVLTENTTSFYAYFPNDTWYDLYSGQLLDLSQSQTVTLNNTLPALIPIHVRGGSIIPTLDSYNNVTNVIDLRASNTTLIIALDDTGAASGNLVLDDGEDAESLTGGYYTELQFQYSAFGSIQDVLQVTPIKSGYELAANEFPNISTLEIFGCSGTPLQVSLYNGNSVRTLVNATLNYEASLSLCHIKFLDLIATDAFGVFYISYA